MKSVICLVIHVAVCVLVATPPRARCLAQSLHVQTVMLNDSHPKCQLVPFPENTLCLHVNVTHTHPYGCHWTINNTQAAAEQHREFVLHADRYTLVLQPFGQHFHYTVCACRVIESGDEYTVMMGGPDSPTTGPSITRCELTTSDPTTGPTNDPTSDSTSDSTSDPTSDPTSDSTDNTISDSTSESTDETLNDPHPGALTGLLLIPVAILTVLWTAIVVSVIMVYARRKHQLRIQQMFEISAKKPSKQPL